MAGYGQYCPVAKAAEVFAERWTPLVIRNLYLGCRSFGEILEGVPRMSRALLAKRLRELERCGVVAREPSPRGRGSRYSLTRAGQELAEVCLALGTWGARWLEVAPEDSDPFVVLWGWKKFVRRDELPPKRVVVRFDLRDRPKERYWLLLDRQDVELCVKPPDLDEDLVVTTDSETLMRVHMGRLSFQEAMRQNRWTIEGTPQLVRGFPRWGGLSYYAGVPSARAVS